MNAEVILFVSLSLTALGLIAWAVWWTRDEGPDSALEERAREAHRLIVLSAARDAGMEIDGDEDVRECTECPWVTGDITERDCCFPDCAVVKKIKEPA